MKMNSSSQLLPFLRRQAKSQSAVEFALAFPIFLIIIFGIIDFSLLFTAWLSIQNMARQSVRYAATSQYEPKYCDYADQTATFSLPNGSTVRVGDGTSELYTSGNPIPCSSNNSSNTLAVKYKNQEIDYARLQSVHDIANKFNYFIFDNPASTQYTETGFLHTTVCSGRDYDLDKGADLVNVKPNMGGRDAGDYSSCYLEKTRVLQEDAGGSGDYVYVTVDFNHPFLTPFINSMPGMDFFHLSSYREAKVEKFRISTTVDIQTPGLLPPLQLNKIPLPTLPRPPRPPDDAIMPPPDFIGTPNCSLSGGIKTTDSQGTIMNAMQFGCPTGCFDEPFLRSGQDDQNNSLPPGTYFWQVEEVNKPKWIVNSGSFFLPVGKVIHPVNGVRVPIGNFTNPPLPEYYRGQFKVSIWQSDKPSCGAKSDNFTILASEPSRTPFGCTDCGFATATPSGP